MPPMLSKTIAHEEAEAQKADIWSSGANFDGCESQSGDTVESVSVPSVPCNSLFQQPWWLDAVAPGAWSAVEVRQGDRVTARLPFVLKERFGFKMLTMPPLTQTLGPWLEPSTAKYANQLAQQKELMTALIDQLPPHTLFSQNFHYSITNWLPFYWSGFTQTTRYTYIIEDLSCLDRVWKEMSTHTRRNIRKAQKLVKVRHDLSIEQFLELNRMTFQRKGRALPYHPDVVRRLDAAAAARGARRLFFAEDEQGNLHGAIYLVWDTQSAYYLMGGLHPDFTSSGAISLLMWEAIQFSATVTQMFNFEGSMIESIEKFFRDFGAIQKPYFQIKKNNALPIRLLVGVARASYRWRAAMR